MVKLEDDKRKKLVSFLIVMVLITTGFSIMIQITEKKEVKAETINEDWIISNETYRCNETIILNGNLTINQTGSLTLFNVTLKINSTYDGQYSIVVHGGGDLYVYFSKIEAFNPNFHYNFQIWKPYLVYLYKDTYVTIFDTNITDTYGGIEIYGGNTTITNSRISHGKTDGIFIMGNLENDINAIITENLISENDESGIKIISAPDLIITQNNVTNNSIGIELNNSNLKIVGGSTLLNYDKDIYVYNFSNPILLDVEFNRSHVNVTKNSTLTVNWTLHLQTVDFGNICIPHAQTSVKDNNVCEIFNETSNEHGELGPIECKEYLQSADQSYNNATFFNPHNISSYKNNFTGYLNLTINTTMTNIIIIPGPNLGIEGILNCTPLNESLSYLNFSIKNTGNINVTNILVCSYDSRFIFGEGEVAMNILNTNLSIINSTVIPSLNSSEEKNVTFIWNPKEYMHFIKIDIDKFNNLSENDKDNNVYLQCLYLEETENSDPYVVYGYVLDVDGTPVENATVVISNSITSIFCLTDFIGRYDQNLLNIQGYQESDNISIYAMKGLYQTQTIVFKPDKNGGKMVILNFTQEIRSTHSPGDPGPKPNLKIFEVLFKVIEEDGKTFEDGNLLINHSVIIEPLIYYTGFNNGTNVTIQFLCEKGIYWENRTIQIDPEKEIATTHFTWNAFKVGMHNFTLKIDPDDNISESNESDNIMNVTRTVRSLLSFYLEDGWNNATFQYLDDNFTAGSCIAGTFHELKYVSRFNLTTQQYENYIYDFSNSLNNSNLPRESYNQILLLLVYNNLRKNDISHDFSVDTNITYWVFLLTQKIEENQTRGYSHSKDGTIHSVSKWNWYVLFYTRSGYNVGLLIWYIKWKGWSVAANAALFIPYVIRRVNGITKKVQIEDKYLYWVCVNFQSDRFRIDVIHCYISGKTGHPYDKFHTHFKIYFYKNGIIRPIIKMINVPKCPTTDWKGFLYVNWDLFQINGKDRSSYYDPIFWQGEEYASWTQKDYEWSRGSYYPYMRWDSVNYQTQAEDQIYRTVWILWIRQRQGVHLSAYISQYYGSATNYYLKQEPHPERSSPGLRNNNENIINEDIEYWYYYYKRSASTFYLQPIFRVKHYVWYE
jgi:hypothetical protein